MLRWLSNLRVSRADIIMTRSPSVSWYGFYVSSSTAFPRSSNAMSHKKTRSVMEDSVGVDHGVNSILRRRIMRTLESFYVCGRMGSRLPPGFCPFSPVRSQGRTLAPAIGIQTSRNVDNPYAESLSLLKISRFCIPPLKPSRAELGFGRRETWPSIEAAIRPIRLRKRFFATSSRHPHSDLRR
jgi:hypothetical protein